jgi:hypothetical protein
MKEKKATANSDKTRPKPHRVHLPAFLLEEEIGLGDVIKHATYAVGIRPCAGCEHRASVLNHWMRFSR